MSSNTNQLKAEQWKHDKCVFIIFMLLMTMLLALAFIASCTPENAIPEAVSIVRLSHDAADTWADQLYNQLNVINKPLAQSYFGDESYHAFGKPYPQQSRQSYYKKYQATVSKQGVKDDY